MGLAVLVRDDEGGAARLAVTGEIDLNNVGEFDAALRALLADSRHALVDLSEVTHFGSTAIGALVGAHRIAGERRIRMTVRPSRIVRRVLEVTNLDDTFALTEPPSRHG